jgi:hypothetical protein
MNTKNREDQKKQRQKGRQEHRPKKRGQNPSIQQDHEHPETRLTR